MERGGYMDAIGQDARHALRAWRKAPAFTIAVVLTMSFGIAANTTVFSVINTLFLNPLPVNRPSELVAVRTVDAGARSNVALPLSYPNLKDFASRNQLFDHLAGHSSPTTLTLLDGETPQRLFGELVTGNYFETLGIHPARGRFFLPQEDVTPGAAPVLVLAYGAWQRRFGGAPDIVGRTMHVNGVAFSVIGVAPEGFKGVNVVFGPDVWIPSMMAESVLPASMRDWLRNRGALGFRGVARLKPGVTPSQAAANLATIAAALEREYPDANRGRSVVVEPLTRAALLAAGGMSATAISLVLLAIPALVLLIACSNVAHLLLARAAGRRQEIAVRLALGSSRSRLMRQLLTESILLACISGIVGAGFAYAGGRLLWSFRPPEVATNLIDLDVNSTVFLFTLVVSLATGVIFGLVPAWQATRTDVVRALNEDGRSVGQSRRGVTVGKILLVGQVALSLVSLTTAGLLLRSVQQAYAIDPGFETTRLGVAMISPGQAGYSRVRTEQFYDDVLARMASVHGVVSATWATQLPLFARPSGSVMAEGRDERDRTNAVMTIVNATDVNYFATTGIALTRGREFQKSDRAQSLPVAIVNETLAKRLWPNVDPLGRRFRLNGDTVTWQVVGVATTANYESMGEAPQPCVYVPLRQQFSDAAVLYVRTAGDPTAVLGEVQRQVRSIDTHLEVGDVRTIQKVISQALFGATIGVGLLGVFGLVALGLACMGLYGAMAHAVTRRHREIGVRMALGAPPRAVLRLVLAQGLSVVGIGIAIGAGASALVGEALSRLLVGVNAFDPVGVAVACLMLLVAAATACYLPARRASRLDPLIALCEG